MDKLGWKMEMDIGRVGRKPNHFIIRFKIYFGYNGENLWF